MPLLTAIIPTHNRAHLLGPALDSIAAQSVRDVEVIVVDDDSSDGTAELVQARRDVTYVHVERQGQPAAVRNVGIERARSEYLAFLDSDDRWLPGKIERQLSILRGSSEDVFSSRMPLLSNRRRRGCRDAPAVPPAPAVGQGTAVGRSPPGQQCHRLDGAGEDAAVRASGAFSIFQYSAGSRTTTCGYGSWRGPARPVSRASACRLPRHSRPVHEGRTISRRRDPRTPRNHAPAQVSAR